VGYTIEEDTVVPRAELPALIKGVKAMGKQYDFDVICYGHAGDGNLHIRIRKEGVPNSFGHEPMQAIIAELFKLVHGLGGTISAEHGIGLIQKSFMPIVFEETSLRLMRDIKRSFDPNGILNADKIF
jgi:glycolate oxidase